MYLEVLVVSFDATRQADQPIFDANLTFSPTFMSTIFQEVRSSGRSDVAFLSRWPNHAVHLSLILRRRGRQVSCKRLHRQVSYGWNRSAESNVLTFLCGVELASSCDQDRKDSSTSCGTGTGKAQGGCAVGIRRTTAVPTAGNTIIQTFSCPLLIPSVDLTMLELIFFFRNTVRWIARRIQDRDMY